jgi:hypothetical protein
MNRRKGQDGGARVRFHQCFTLEFSRLTGVRHQRGSHPLMEKLMKTDILAANPASFLYSEAGAAYCIPHPRLRLSTGARF